MEFFRVHEAVGTRIPTYFIESTAPYNVDDTQSPESKERKAAASRVQKIDSDEAIKQIAARLLAGSRPNLVVMVHGFNNPEPAVLKMYTSAALAVDRDQAINGGQGLVCVGYRWPSERMGMPWRGTWDALPTLPTWILYFGALVVLFTFPLFYFTSETRQWWIDVFRYVWNPTAVHFITLLGWTIAGLVLMTVLLRTIVYFRDHYRASNYGVPDLIQVISVIDAEIMRQHRQSGEASPPPSVELSFIGHSMGAFVVTNAIRALSDVFAVPAQSLNSYGAAATDEAPRHGIGRAFQLKRFVLASPDIPAETLLSSRSNFLASALSRFDEAYLFSNEGDAVLRQISTLANYFVFPTKSKNHGFRLGNVEILSRNFGLIDVGGADFLRVLRIGNRTLQQLYDDLEDAKAQRQPTQQLGPEQAPLPQRFTYFDCTDYVDIDDPNEADKQGNRRPLLTFAKWKKRDDAEAQLRWYSHLWLLIVYVFNQQKPNVHGGYFEGQLSQQLIYRLACLGYGGTVAAYGGEPALGKVCEEKQIRMLVSPMLWSARTGATPVAPPRPANARTRSAPRGPAPQAVPAGVIVPDLVGKPIVDARAQVDALRGSGQTPQLVLVEVARTARGTGQAVSGFVLSQTPAPGTSVKGPTSIEVIVVK
ncbi:PASTA domain-containing protein [Bradyrhizobium sp. CCBAU 51753]|uniref:PASTA domain-containing protein n=1 Tax=Bradyrhizobium sp. CCBAU 51753 TaxID=1325100 RepID=UPI001889FE92|nr:PASTA domain-containing protein [Bradyrhizobium sp. CCBAU 51753]QOZ28700.1 hypothetical protein XH93_37985 [Bradyrhizobium sp. CCBAU 51753]